MYHRIKHHLRRHTISFKHAIDGVIWALRTQPNYRVHLVLSLLSVSGGIVYRITYFEWLMIVFLVTGGLAIETINSALEQTLDCISTTTRDDIKIAKDAAAAAMLLFAVGAFLIACMIFVPRILQPVA